MNDATARLNAALEGRYRIERELGEGGMATVYLADDLRHERKVALKVLKPELAAVVGADRFLAEIKTTANLQHPHILPLFDSGAAGSFLFYVMPYVQGESLRERLDREHQLPVDEAVGIATKVAGALQAAHDQGVIHRDIKPANILLSKGEPLVSDFGIALALGAAGAGRLTETGLSLGTPHYMSPEQATGDVGVGAATDVYAVGCVLYEMLVGEPPYTGSTPQAVLGKIVTGEAPSARGERRSVPPNVDAAIRRALEKVPADRFLSASDFTGALGDPGFRHGEGTATTSSVTRGRKRSTVLGWSTAAVLLLGLAWELGRPEAPPPSMLFEITLPQGFTRTTNSGSSVDISPDGSRLVLVARAPDDDAPRLWVRRLDELLPRALPGTEGAMNPRFSRDGSSIAFTSRGALRVISPDGGQGRTLVPDSVDNRTGGIAWGPDRTLYFTRPDGAIWSVSDGGGSVRRVTTLQEGELGHYWPEVLPDGSTLLFTKNRGFLGDGDISAVSLETGEPLDLSIPGGMARYSATGHLLYSTGQVTSSRTGAAALTLMAVPFDATRLRLAGDARVLVEGISVTASLASGFTVSRTGVLVYVPQNQANAGLMPVWVRRDGLEEPLDTRLGVGFYNSPTISPDGSKIAFAFGPTFDEAVSEIWIYDLAQGGTFSPLVTAGFSANPFWSPDGEELAFLSSRDSPGFNAVYAQRLDGAGSVRLLRAVPGQSIWGGVWAPDGRIVYRQGTAALGERLGIYIAPANPDSPSAVVIDTEAPEIAPSVSPNGRWIAYQSRDATDGEPNIYVRPLTGPGATVQVSLAGGERPLWAHNGREIFYWSRDDSLYVASVREEPSFVVGSREGFASSREYVIPSGQRPWDVSPDDQRVLLLRRVEGVARDPRDVVVTNFAEILLGTEARR